MNARANRLTVGALRGLSQLPRKVRARATFVDPRRRVRVRTSIIRDLSGPCGGTSITEDEVAMLFGHGLRVAPRVFVLTTRYSLSKKADEFWREASLTSPFELILQGPTIQSKKANRSGRPHG
jgi:hypothetical protein